MQVLSLEASLSAVHNERSQSDMGLKSRMQELLSELQSTLQVWPSLCNSTKIWCCCLSCSCWLNKSTILRHNLQTSLTGFCHSRTAESLMDAACALHGIYLRMCEAHSDFDEYIPSGAHAKFGCKQCRWCNIQTLVVIYTGAWSVQGQVAAVAESAHVISVHC